MHRGGGQAAHVGCLRCHGQPGRMPWEMWLRIRLMFGPNGQTLRHNSLSPRRQALPSGLHRSSWWCWLESFCTTRQWHGSGSALCSSFSVLNASCQWEVMSGWRKYSSSVPCCSAASPGTADGERAPGEPRRAVCPAPLCSAPAGILLPWVWHALLLTPPWNPDPAIPALSSCRKETLWPRICNEFLGRAQKQTLLTEPREVDNLIAKAWGDLGEVSRVWSSLRWGRGEGLEQPVSLLPQAVTKESVSSTVLGAGLRKQKHVNRGRSSLYFPNHWLSSRWLN